MTTNLPAINLEEIKKKMLALPQANCPVFHHFGPGLYIRELRMEAGTLAMGRKQRFPHMNVFIKGKVLMLNPDGSHLELSAPMTFVGSPGQKIGYVIEDMIWQNIYPTNETDVEILEATYFDDPTESGIVAAEDDSELSTIRSDYEKLLLEIGYTQADVDMEVLNPEDQIPMPYGWFKTCIRASKIHGKGLFASGGFLPEDIIVPLSIDGKRTPAGRYTNHSPNPNARLAIIGNDIVAVAIDTIFGCRGGDIGEEITINYRESLSLRGIFCKEEI